jgi:small subunit ribosomal protein S4
MGDIKRKRKMYVRPRQLFNRERIDAENVILKEYGLKNKREIWKAKSIVATFRKRAKNLISSNQDEQQAFFDKLNKLGFSVTSTSDALALTEKDLLGRRLQTIVHKQGLSATAKQARQLIVHQYVLVDGAVVSAPSFWVTKELESKITLKPKKEKVVETPVEEASAEAPKTEDENTEEAKE